MTEGQSSPSMDGDSAKFSVGGPTGYSNELYWNPIGGGNNVSHFTCDLYFYIDQPLVAQALESDFEPTIRRDTVDCKLQTFPANTWIHLGWNVSDQVHYISLTVGHRRRSDLQR